MKLLHPFVAANNERTAEMFWIHLCVAPTQNLLNINAPGPWQVPCPLLIQADRSGAQKSSVCGRKAERCLAPRAGRGFLLQSWGSCPWRRPQSSCRAMLGMPPTPRAALAESKSKCSATHGWSKMKFTCGSQLKAEVGSAVAVGKASALGLLLEIWGFPPEHCAQHRVIPQQL